MSRATLLTGNCLGLLPTLPAGSVRCCITSPPYFGLRDYGHEGQLGLEPTPDAYVAQMVAVFRAVRDVLTDDGTLWLNLGDTYAGSGKGAWGSEEARQANAGKAKEAYVPIKSEIPMAGKTPAGFKPKDLIGIPWRVAFALQADGWYLRSDIIWAKPNPMPESVTDRPTKAHEYVFLLSKSARYYYDHAAIADPIAEVTARDPRTNDNGQRRERGFPGQASNGGTRLGSADTRNARTVWTIPTQPYAGAHFATFPEALARRCLLAGSAPGDTVLDPFSGSGTVASVAVGHGRKAIGIELNPAYQDLAVERIGPMLCEVAA